MTVLEADDLFERGVRRLFQLSEWTQTDSEIDEI